jgi:DNA-binding transcriptional MerR regulator/quercetin dioxygenase-like cupin family protein
MRIADLSRLTGVPASTLRLWESHGLIAPGRSANGYRVYAPGDVQRVEAIRRLRDVEGLNLPAIRSVLGGAAEGEGARPAATPWNLGARLRALREARRLSMRAVAAATGLPISLLSTLERTSRGASVASLHALAKCYGTTFNELTRLAGPGFEPVVRSGAGRVIPTLGRGIRVEQLAEGQRLMDCQRWVLEAGAGSEGAYAHGGEEFIHVIAGGLEVTLDGGQPFRLAAGDSIAFESSRLHAWRAPGPGPTELLWVNCEPPPAASVTGG